MRTSKQTSRPRAKSIDPEHTRPHTPSVGDAGARLNNVLEIFLNNLNRCARLALVCQRARSDKQRKIRLAFAVPRMPVLFLLYARFGTRVSAADLYVPQEDSHAPFNDLCGSFSGLHQPASGTRALGAGLHVAQSGSHVADWDSYEGTLGPIPSPCQQDCTVTGQHPWDTHRSYLLGKERRVFAYHCCFQPLPTAR